METKKKGNQMLIKEKEKWDLGYGNMWWKVIVLHLDIPCGLNNKNKLTLCTQRLNRLHKGQNSIFVLNTLCLSEIK